MENTPSKRLSSHDHHPGRLCAGTLQRGLITETIFAWPGMGRLLYDSVILTDYYVAMMAFMALAVLTLLFNLLADLAYGWADPRVKQEGAT